MTTKSFVRSSGRPFTRSEALYRAGRAYTTEGVQHAGRFQEPHPIYMESGEGGLIFDADGNRYIDFSLGSGPLILGHRHPRVVEAVQRQMGKSQLYGSPSQVELELARRIHARVPSAEQTRFVSSGTEATSLAIRLARAFTKRDLIVKHIGAFHGAMDYFMSGMPLAGGTGDSYPGIDSAIADKTLAVPFNDFESLDQIFTTHGSRIAAMIVEPVLRGVLLPETGYLQALRERCSSFGTLLVFDEVVTGFRLGPAGAEGYFGVRPDLSAFGKIVGGGFPVGAVAGREDIMYLLSPRCPPSERVYSSGTWLGFPVAMAAGSATLDVLDEDDAYGRLFRLGDRFRNRFNAIFERLGLPGQAIGIGPVNKVVLTDVTVRDLDSSQPRYRKDGLVALKSRLLELGLNMLGPYYVPGLGKYLCIAHTDEQIDEAAALFERAIVETNLASYLAG